jgi:hypothetical protein
MFKEQQKRSEEFLTGQNIKDKKKGGSFSCEFPLVKKKGGIFSSGYC